MSEARRQGALLPSTVPLDWVFHRSEARLTNGGERVAGYRGVSRPRFKRRQASMDLARCSRASPPMP